MEIKEGTRVKSNLTGEVYRVKAIKGMAVVMETEDMSSSASVITEFGTLRLFYKMLEHENRSKDPLTCKKSSFLSIAAA